MEFLPAWSSIVAPSAYQQPKQPNSRAPRLQAAYVGKTCQNAVLTTISPPSGYQALLMRWLLGGGPLLPLDWGTFNLAFHAWRQPVQRQLEAADATVPLRLPTPGQRVDVAAGPLNSRWWEQ